MNGIIKTHALILNKIAKVPDKLLVFNISISEDSFTNANTLRSGPAFHTFKALGAESILSLSYNEDISFMTVAEKWVILIFHFCK